MPHDDLKKEVYEKKDKAKSAKRRLAKKDGKCSHCGEKMVKGKCKECGY